MQEIYTLSVLLSIFSFAFVMVITPGPNNILLLSSGLNFGYKKSLPSIFGVMLGFPIMVIIVGLGIGIIFKNYPYVYYIMKIIGIIYLFYIAYQIATSNDEIKSSSVKEKKPFTFIQIVIFQWLNPKAWVMAITSTTLYVTNNNHSIIQVFIIAFIFLLMGIISTNSWTLGGVFLQNILKIKLHIKIFNIFMAVLIIVSVLPILFSK